MKRTARRQNRWGIDLKWTHLMKSRDLGLYQGLTAAHPHHLPFRSRAFLYFPHGLVERGEALEYKRVLHELSRVVAMSGTLLLTAFDDGVRDHFVCHELQRFLERRGFPRMARFFERMDGGRHREISGLARQQDEWRTLMAGAGFTVQRVWRHVRPVAWRIYDTQTRPVFHQLIAVSQRLGVFRTPVKLLTILFEIPIVLLVYVLWARPKDAPESTGLLCVFEATRKQAT